MCGRPDFGAEYEELDKVVLAAFWAYQECRQRLHDTENEEAIDWIKAFCDAVGSRLRSLETEGKLVAPSEDRMT